MLIEPFTRVRTQFLEAKYCPPFLMLEGLFERHPYIVPIAQQMVKHPNEFWHMTMVAKVYEDILGSLFTKGYLARRDLGYYDLATLSAFLHDIGKFGIDPSGIDQSLAIVNYVSDAQKKARPDKDLRLAQIRATQNLHPLIGGYMINLMVEMGLIPKELAKVIAASAFEHHENNSNEFKTSFPRPYRRLESPSRTFVDLLVQLADVAVGMREKRPYRDKLTFSTIEAELNLYLQNQKLLKYIGLIINFYNKDFEQINDLRKLLIREVLASVNSVDEAIREVPDLSLIKWNESKVRSDINTHLLLERLIAEVWKSKQDRLSKAYEYNLKSDYIHLSRN